MRILLMLSAPVLVLLNACAANQMNMGSQQAKTTATGAAGGATAVDANSALERCDRPVGTAAFIEDTGSQWYGVLTSQYKLPSTTMVLQQLAQQSNCFVVVERGRGMAAIQGERALERSGEMRNDSNFGKGQLVAADYAITPSITFSSGNTGGASGGVVGLPGRLSVLGGVSGGVRNREASTMLALTDNRSGIQVAIAEGSASKMDVNIGLTLFGARGAGTLGGYQSTPEGKVLVAAFTDSFNQLVRAVKNYTPQQAPAGSKGLGTGGSLKTN